MHDIYSDPVLGIDLGASFTKIAYRPGWNGGKYYEDPCRLLMIEGNSLIPSLVIHTNEQRNQWLCGKTAARYKPTKGDRVFTKVQ